MNEIKKYLDSSPELNRVQSLYSRVTQHINAVRQNIHRSINIEMVQTYFLIGKEIIEEEQQGENRAAYGKKILQALSVELQKEYKRGFSVDTLLLYQSDFQNSISGALRRKSDEAEEMPDFTLYRKE